MSIDSASADADGSADQAGSPDPDPAPARTRSGRVAGVLNTVVGVVGIGLLLGLAGLWLGGRFTGERSPAGPAVTISHGTHGREAWSIQAANGGDDGRLCLTVLVTRTDDTLGPDEKTGACGFDGEPSGGRFISWMLDDGSTIMAGPVPARADRVWLVGSGPFLKTVVTKPLPASLPEGRFFVTRLPAGYSGSYEFVAFDADKRLVPLTDF